MPHTKAALANKFDEWESYLGALKLPAWDELPTLELYMDQVVIILNDYLGMYAAGEDKTVTQAMINNYVKQKLIPPAGEEEIFPRTLGAAHDNMHAEANA